MTDDTDEMPRWVPVARRIEYLTHLLSLQGIDAGRLHELSRLRRWLVDYSRIQRECAGVAVMELHACLVNDTETQCDEWLEAMKRMGGAAYNA